MIKYLELTAPPSSAFRQAKILSIECGEGDRVNEGTTLFRVKSGEQEIDLPSTQEGRVVEMIATVGESITLSTALLLLETEVEGSTATPPISATDTGGGKEQELEKPAPNKQPEKKRPEKKARAQKKAAKTQSQNQTDNEQVSLELLAENFQLTQEVAPTAKPSVSSNAKNINAKNKPDNKPSSPATSKTMSSNSTIEVSVPDIGTDSAKVIEILVKVGDTVTAEDALITLESDKASMDVPSTHDGVISAIEVAVDQDVSEGTVIIKLDSQSHSDTEPASEVTSEPTADDSDSAVKASATDEAPASNATASKEQEVVIPDIGGDSAKVIEILVSVGDQINVEDALVTLESDKASMDVPSTLAGEVSSIEVKIDQDVSEGTVVAKVITTGSAASNETKPASSDQQFEAKAQATSPAAQQSAPQSAQKTTQTANESAAVPTGGKSHASPSVRRFARELGVDLSKVTGTGRKSRVTQEDVKGFVKGVITNNSGAAGAASGGAGIPAIPEQDFSKFGEIEVQPLNKIKRLTATNLHRAWLNVPHVTHNDEANISDLESFRKQLNTEAAKRSDGVKLSPLAFIVKAVVHALRHYPQFNSSLDSNGENLILKKYFNIGIAVETPNGLVVPVLRDADKMSISEIAQEMGTLAAKARDKKLTMADMSGACFTISSLGGIGGTGFTPIVNAPEVAILGVSRSKMAPVWNGKDFEPGMMLPVSLSYDHRVIDGAEAARFTRHIAAVLEDVRRLTV